MKTIKLSELRDNLPNIGLVVGDMDKKEFVKWLKLGSKRDCLSIIPLLEKEEMYEYCEYVLEHINSL